MFGELWKSVPFGFKLYWAACLVVGLGVMGVMVWAVIKIVSHITGA